MEGKELLLGVMPLPEKVKFSKGHFKVSWFTRCKIIGDKGSKRVKHCFNKFFERLVNKTGVFFENEMVIDNEKSGNAPFVVEFKETVKSLKCGTDEEYTLKVTDQSISLKARTDIGVLRGSSINKNFCYKNKTDLEIKNQTKEWKQYSNWFKFSRTPTEMSSMEYQTLK